MKKLMIAAAIVCAAALSQAADFQWRVGMSTVLHDGTDSGIYAGTVYLFNAKTVDQATLISTLGTYDTVAQMQQYLGTTAIDTGTANASGKMGTYKAKADISKLAPTYTPESGGTMVDVYIAMLAADGKSVYVDKTSPFPLNTASGGNTQMQFTSAGDASKNSWGDATFATKGAGWYDVNAVPEPTSGLLLLLGVAGLALRRRRA